MENTDRGRRYHSISPGPGTGAWNGSPSMVMIHGWFQNGPPPTPGTPRGTRSGRLLDRRSEMTRPVRVLYATDRKAYNGEVVCPQVALARGSREPGQALTGAALSGVLLCGGLLRANTRILAVRDSIRSHDGHCGSHVCDSRLATSHDERSDSEQGRIARRVPGCRSPVPTAKL